MNRLTDGSGCGFLREDERITLKLRALYAQCGYKKYRMSRFEEYDLYLDNKNFLSEKHIITFNDLNGRVLALKPDVTLSIVKNTRATEQSTEKIYYQENIYRLDRKSRAYREIGQLGLECFGRLDDYQISEVVLMAAKTLSVISEDYRMTLSHSGFVLKLLEGIDVPVEVRQELIECMKLKRAHEIRGRAEHFSVTPAVAEMLASIAELGGPFEETLKRAREIAIIKSMTDALDQLEMVYTSLRHAGFTDKVRLDFSLINDLDYYSGIVFQGFCEGVPRAVLSGGYYGALLKKFGRDLDAIGFAVYLNELDHFRREPSDADVDVLVLYSEGADPGALYDACERLKAEGLSVRVERSAPDDLKARRTYQFSQSGLQEVTDRA